MNDERADEPQYKYYLFNDTADFIHNKSCLQQHTVRHVTTIVIKSGT